MSNIDSLRKLLQDFIAPELRAVSVRLDSLEERMESNHANVIFAMAQLKSRS